MKYYRITIQVGNKRPRGLFYYYEAIYGNDTGDVEGKLHNFLIRLTVPKLPKTVQFWFTNKGYKEYQKVRNMILDAISMDYPDGETIQDLVEVVSLLTGIVYQDELQVAVKSVKKK